MEQTIFLLTQTGLGHAEAGLQELMLHNFLRTLSGRDPASFLLILYTDGVKLAIEDSPFLVDLRALEQRGVQILACGTCLDYFKLRERLAAGRVSSMDEIVGLFSRAARVVTV